MKNILKVFGIIALVTVIGFSMTACDDGDDGNGGGGGGVNRDSKLVGIWRIGTGAYANQIDFRSNGDFFMGSFRYGSWSTSGTTINFTSSALGTATYTLSNSDQTLTISGSSATVPNVPFNINDTYTKQP